MSSVYLSVMRHAAKNDHARTGFRDIFLKSSSFITVESSVAGDMAACRMAGGPHKISFDALTWRWI